MSTLWRKVLRDFWEEKTRSLLVVAAIALGIAAFSAVLSSYAILNRELNQGYLATNPASATLRLDAIDEALLKDVAALPGVGAAEARRVASGRIKSGPAQWRTLMLFVVRDYAAMRVGTIAHEAGAWPPGKGEILIERDAFQVAKARIGDAVTVKTPGGDYQTLRVTGGVHDVGQAQARMENVVYGYITLDTLALLGEPPVLDRLEILVSQDRFDRARIADVAGRVKAFLEARGHAVRRVDIPEPGKHPHADLMGMLLLAISTFGLLVLALSGVLVVNLLTALMASQVRQIGMMKAVGATRGQIARIYLGQAGLLGVAAVILALPLGMLGARALCRYLAVFLNFDVTSFAVPFWVYALVALVGLVTPLLAAAYPVAKGSALTVSAALADFGVVDRGFGTDPLDRALAGLSGLARPVLFAIRNSFRRRTRLALTLLTLSVSGLFFMSALNVRASMINTIDRLFGARKFDLSINLGAMVPVESMRSAVARTPGARVCEGWIVTQATVVAASSKESAAGAPAGLHDGGGSAGHAPETPPASRLSVLGLAPGTQLLRLEIDQGRGLEPSDEDAMVVNSAFMARHPEVKVGQNLILQMGPTESTWRVVGVSHEAFAAPTAYIWRTYFDRAGGHTGMANSVRVSLDRSDAASIDRFREALDRNLEAEGIRALSTTSTADSRYGFDQHMLMIYIFLVAMSVIIGGVGGLGLMTTMSLNVMERRREMGVLRAIGASTPAIWLIVVAEALAIGLMSFLVAASLASPLSRALGDFIGAVLFQTDLSFVFEPNGLLICFLASLVLSALASFLPAWHASRSSVREALGFE
ncbi:MAG: ABC transporter permease [Vicinamibacteria bacterium]|nr:ABC transporter permease [Vicinamibacteria bacterium]